MTLLVPGIGPSIQNATNASREWLPAAVDFLSTVSGSARIGCYWAANKFTEEAGVAVGLLLKASEGSIEDGGLKTVAEHRWFYAAIGARDRVRCRE